MIFLCGGPPHQDMFDLKPDDDLYWCGADIGWMQVSRSADGFHLRQLHLQADTRGS